MLGSVQHGKDHDCYGRLPYDYPHMTVHSYHKPHWHKSLKPYESQVQWHSSNSVLTHTGAA
eukprot:1908422-Pyramimonas_sp.AAC.1